MELGFGATGAWAASWFDEAKAEAVLETAITQGIRHFDTAGFYAGGDADARLARALNRLEGRGIIDRSTLTISTKIGKSITENGQLIRDFREVVIVEAVERHRQLFRGKMPDIVYMHGPDEEERHQCLHVLQRLKSDGMLGAVGDCSDGPALMSAAKTDGIDVVMGRYHFLNTDNALAFQEAKLRSKKVVSIAPLAQALWRRSLFLPRRLSDVWYLARALRRDPKTTLAAQRAGWIRNVENWPASHLALGFVRMNENIDVVLTTSTQGRHLIDSAQGFARHLPEEITALLKDRHTAKAES